jgi:hypothetical protein
MHKLTDKGVEVVGISGDSVQTHALFKKAQTDRGAQGHLRGGSAGNHPRACATAPSPRAAAGPR